MKLFGQLVEDSPRVGLFQARRLGQLVGNNFPLPGAVAGFDVVFEILIEHGQSRRILLLDCHVRKGRGDSGGVVELAPSGVAIPHRCIGHRLAGIDNTDQLQVGLLQVLLEVDLVGLAEHLPVHVAYVVAGDVLPVLGKLDTDALQR